MLTLDFSIHQIIHELISLLVLIQTHTNIALNQFTLFLHYFVNLVVQFMLAAFLRCQFPIVILTFWWFCKLCESRLLVSGVVLCLGLYHDLFGVSYHLAGTLEIQIELFAPFKDFLDLGALVLGEFILSLSIWNLSLTASWMQHRAIFDSGFRRASSVSMNSFFVVILVSWRQEKPKIWRFKLLRVIIVIFIFAAFFFQLLNIALNFARTAVVIFIMNTIFSRYRVIQLILCNRKWLQWLGHFGRRINPMHKSWRIFSSLSRWHDLWFGHFAYAGDWALSKFGGLGLWYNILRWYLLGLPGLFILKSYSEIRIGRCIEIGRFGCHVFLGCRFDSVRGLIIGADRR